MSDGYGDEREKDGAVVKPIWLLTMKCIAAARYSVDKPSWEISTTHSISPADGAFNASSEGVLATIDTSGWAPGRYTIFVESQDTAGNWGAPTER